MKKTPRNREKLPIVKSNQLIEARYSLSVVEQRIILLMIASITPDDTDFKPIKLKVSELQALLNIKNKNFYSEIQEATKNLISKVVIIKKGKRKLQISWLSSAEYHEGEGTVELSFDPKLKPYLLQLKEQFTVYALENVINFKSAYSVRIYELLKQYELIGERIIELHHLRQYLQIEDKYRDFTNIRQRILERAQKELKEKSDLSFTYEPIKEGKKVKAIKFTIKKNKPRNNTEGVLFGEIDNYLTILDDVIQDNLHYFEEFERYLKKKKDFFYQTVFARLGKEHKLIKIEFLKFLDEVKNIKPNIKYTDFVDFLEKSKKQDLIEKLNKSEKIVQNLLHYIKWKKENKKSKWWYVPLVDFI